jgi:hypothetical protein
MVLDHVDTLSHCGMEHQMVLCAVALFAREVLPQFA